MVPLQDREMMLNELHQGHLGVSRMKSLAKMYVWWPGLDKDIESSVQSCTECQATQSVPSHLLCTLGAGQHVAGPGCMWTMLARFKDTDPLGDRRLFQVD